MRIAIVGGGINGYCCAVRILEKYKTSSDIEISVTVISDEFSPNTTGDGSAGLWGPYLLGGTPTAKAFKWSKDMHDFLEQLWLSEDASEAGICLIPVVRVTTSNEFDNFWKDIVYGCTPLTTQQLHDFNKNRTKKFTRGMHFVTYTSEPCKLLPYLMKRFHAQGGRSVQRYVASLTQLHDDYDVVINCTGLGARHLLPDENMYAVRGQVARVQANWLYFALLDESDDGNYIIPNVDSVVLGGTHQIGDYNIQVSPNDEHFIKDGCKALEPSLVHARPLYDWVGLRPGRDSVRLEVETATAANTSVATTSQKILIHNYGHGGSGVTLAWGCAGEVLQLLEEQLQYSERNRITRLKSKL